MADLFVRQARAMTQEEVAFCERSIPAAFDGVVARNPEALALDGDEQATFAELAAGADRIACGLRERMGEGSEPVGLLFTSTRGLIEALLGVLKAGKIAMPLDPSASTARFAAVLEDSGARLVLGDVASVPAGEIVAVDELDASDADGAGCDADTDAAAMLIYTSGSTGEPKGVLTRHGTDLHTAVMSAHWLDIGPDSRLGVAYSLSFVAAYSLIFTALVSGATVLRYPVEERGLLGLPGWIADHEVTVMPLLASMVRPVATAAGSSGLPSVRAMSLGAESLAAGDVSVARAMLAPGARLLYACGASEVGTWCWNVLRDSPIAEGSAVPVGVADAGKTVRIVDVEDGVGEVVVTSRYLSHGYWRREDETARAFSAEPGGRERSFRTGDVGRVDEQGRLILAGRRDRMVKIAGKRVELDAIEHALLAHEQVGEAAVVTRQRSTGTPTLVGYVTPRSGDLDLGTVKEGLRRTLPAHMVPGRLVGLQTMPRLPSGKLDRLALTDTRRFTPLTPPRSELERQLVEIWRELLELPVGVDEDFFDLGGDSLLAVAMLVEIEERLGCSLTPGVLVEARTVESLADVIRDPSAPRRQQHVSHSGRDRPCLHFAYPQGGTGLLYFPLAEALADEFPMHILEAPWWDGKPNPLQTLEQLAAHHVAELRQLQPTGPYRLSGFSFGGLLAFEMAQQLTAAGEHVALLAVIDTYLEANGGRDPSDPRSWPMDPPTSFGRWVLRRLWLLQATQRFQARKFLPPVRRLRWRLEQRVLGAVPERRRPEYARDWARRLHDAYELSPYPGRVTLFRCVDDEWPPPDRGWGRVAADLGIHDVPGSHRDDLKGPLLEQLAQKLSEMMRETWDTVAEQGLHPERQRTLA